MIRRLWATNGVPCAAFTSHLRKDFGVRVKGGFFLLLYGSTTMTTTIRTARTAPRGCITAAVPLLLLYHQAASRYRARACLTPATAGRAAETPRWRPAWRAARTPSFVPIPALWTPTSSACLYGELTFNSFNRHLVVSASRLLNRRGLIHSSVRTLLSLVFSLLRHGMCCRMGWRLRQKRRLL